MSSKLFKKYFITSSVIFLAGLTFLSTIFSFFVINYITNEKKHMLSENCAAIVGSLKPDFESNDMTPKMVNALARTADAYIFITNPDGNIIIESNQNDNSADSTVVSKKIIEKAMSTDYFEGGNLDGFFEKELHYTYASPIYNQDREVIGIVFVSTPSSEVRSFFKNMFRMFIIAALIPMVLMFFAEYALTYQLTKPLKLMSNAAKKMAKGDFSQRIPVVSDDEIGDLSISFNNMTNSLVQLESMRHSFIANVSHELRTPMTTIGGFIDGILDGTIEPERQKHYLTIVSDEVKRLSRLVESMLCLAKLESGEQKLNPQKFNMVKVARNIVISQEKRISENNIEIAGLDCDDINVTADMDLIYQVIFNLVDNAIKFTDNGGTISFFVNSDPTEVSFKIRNTGSSISKDDIKYIFDRFYKADKSRSENKNGTGLGLYISKTIIGIHGGKILADSKQNEYAEFSFTLPNIN